MKFLNPEDMLISISRTDLCNIIIACDCLSETQESHGMSGRKWRKLRDDLKSVLYEFDKKNNYGVQI